MIKRFCDRCETELSRDGYVYLSLNVHGSDKYNNEYVAQYDKERELCYKCAELILKTLERY